MLPVFSARRIVLLRRNGRTWATAARGQAQLFALGLLDGDRGL
jgi:hypothetical protein